MKNNFTPVICIIFLFIISCSSNNSTVEEKIEIQLPKYEVIDRVDLINGNKFADLLIEKYSLETPSDSIELALIEIAKIIGVDEISLYCSKDAQKASYSSSFGEKHPEAANCYIGSFKNGKFKINN